MYTHIDIHIYIYTYTSWDISWNTMGFGDFPENISYSNQEVVCIYVRKTGWY